jgi:hypothetical protein
VAPAEKSPFGISTGDAIALPEAPSRTQKASFCMIEFMVFWILGVFSIWVFGIQAQASGKAWPPKRRCVSWVCLWVLLQASLGIASMCYDL